MPKLSASEMAKRRTRIVDAARACFSRHGFEDTSVDEICAEAGLSKGAVYVHFNSKDELIRAVAEARRDRIGSLAHNDSLDDMLSTLAEFIPHAKGDIMTARLEIYAMVRSFADDILREAYLGNVVKLREALVEGIADLEQRGLARTRHGVEMTARHIELYVLAITLQSAMPWPVEQMSDISDLRTLLFMGPDAHDAT